MSGLKVLPRWQDLGGDQLYAVILPQQDDSRTLLVIELYMTLSPDYITQPVGEFDSASDVPAILDQFADTLDSFGSEGWRIMIRPPVDGKASIRLINSEGKRELYALYRTDLDSWNAKATQFCAAIAEEADQLIRYGSEQVPRSHGPTNPGTESLYGAVYRKPEWLNKKPIAIKSHTAKSLLHALWNIG